MTAARTFLLPEHRREIEASGIDPAVMAERGYTSLGRPTAGDDQSRRRLAALGIPKWAIEEDTFFPGLLIPVHGPTGQVVTHQWKPRVPVLDKTGKARRYASTRGQSSRLDVHPRNRDRIADPTVALWLTEGVKKADSLTSRGVCAVALSGVFNWRSQLGTIGDWEDVPLRGRDVVICFDSDARTNMNVLRAMVRLGRWLKGPKGARGVTYLIVPGTVNGTTVKGVDDYFAAGGTLDGLSTVGTTREPNTDTSDGTFSDAFMAEAVSSDVLEDRFRWCPGLDWLEWGGQVYSPVHEAVVTEVVRQYVVDHFQAVLSGMRDGGGQAGNQNAIDGWRSFLGKSRINAVVTLARGILIVDPAELDADPELLNTPGGVVEMPSGRTLPHSPDFLMTKITKGSYRPGYRHPDWERALTVLPKDVMDWFQVRVGQGVTGRTTTDGVVLILQGSGENGKSLLTTDGLLPALGGYGSTVSAKLFMGSKTEHSTERADLRGRRLMVAEELTEGKSIDVTALKQIADVGRIKARFTHKDNIEFDTSHTLFATTNYIPIITETDHGTWRRLALVVFPYLYRKPGEPLTGPNDRRGDPTLKQRLSAGRCRQHDAIVTWAVEGALRYYAGQREIETAIAAGQDPPQSAMVLPEQVVLDTFNWRVEADRILGFWTECLVPDPAAMVLATELLDHFNEWLGGNGHNPWAKETFTPRFKGHQETSAAPRTPRTAVHRHRSSPGFSS